MIFYSENEETIRIKPGAGLKGIIIGNDRPVKVSFDKSDFIVFLQMDQRVLQSYINELYMTLKYIKEKIMSKIWYSKHWKKEETSDFIEWWLDEYGPSVGEPEDDIVQDQYWIRRGFALRGWKAAYKHFAEN